MPINLTPEKRSQLFDKLQSASGEARANFLQGLPEQDRTLVLNGLKEERNIRTGINRQTAIAQAEEEAIAGGRLGTPFAFSSQPEERVAQQQAVTPRPKEFVGGVSELVKQVPADIPGGMLGTAGGAAAGAPFGPPGMIIGGIIGGIGGSTAGKQIDVATGRRPEESALSSLGQSTLEEAAGLGFGVAANIGGRVINKAVIKPLSPQIRRIGSKLGINFNKTPVEQSFITSQTIDPTKVKVRDILDAQDNVLDSRMLTTFEETGGQIGGKEFKDLQDKIAMMKQQNKLTSTALQTRKKINDKIAVKLGDFTDIKPDSLMKTDEQLGNSIKKSFNITSDSYKPEIKATVNELRKIRPQARINVDGVKESIDSLKSDAITELGEKDANLLFRSLDKFFTPTKQTTGELLTGITSPQSKSFADFKALNNNITATLPKFQKNEEIQKKILGWYAGNIKPILQDAKMRAVEQAGPESIQASAFALEKKLANLKEAEGVVRNSGIFRKIGGTEQRQELKNVFADKVLDKVYDSPESWQQTVKALEQSNPELIDTLQGRFKAQIVRDVFDPKTGDISFEKISQLRKKVGDDTIEAIGGQKYLQALEDSQQIALALRASKSLPQTKAAIPRSLMQTTAGLFRPLQQDVTVFNTFTTNAKKLFNLDTVNDKVLFKKLQGKEGQLLFERMLDTPLNSPEAFILYSTFARDVMKQNDILDRQSFEDKVIELEGDIAQGVDRLTKQGEE